MHTRDDPDPLFATAHRPATVEAPAIVERTADAAGTDARAMLELQRMAGNASVSRMLARDAATDTQDTPGGQSPVLDVVTRRGGIRVARPTDDFENAADRHADAALSGPDPGAGSDAALAGRDAASAGPSAQLEPAGPIDETDEEDLTAGAVQRQSNRDSANRP